MLNPELTLTPEQKQALKTELQKPEYEPFGRNFGALAHYMNQTLAPATPGEVSRTIAQSLGLERVIPPMVKEAMDS